VCVGWEILTRTLPPVTPSLVFPPACSTKRPNGDA
jgi:hypothetical protein